MSKRFPDGFLWGASTASYQIEGAVAEDGRGLSIWDTFSHTPGKVVNGDTGDIACDHYHRYPEDVELMRRLGIEAYRFSIAWPRVLPQGTGRVNSPGLDFYDRLVDALLAAGITPWVCLYHWDLPQTLQDRGGWQNRSIAGWFADFAAIVGRRLSDRVRHFATFNEPNVFSLLGHGTAEHAPGLEERSALFKVIHHVNLAHGQAIRALRTHDPSLYLGVINNLSPIVPATTTEMDARAAIRYDALWNRVFADPQFLGRYPSLLEPELAPYLEPEDFTAIYQPLDYFGLNHYNRTVVRHRPGAMLDCASVPPAAGTPVTGMNWEINPGGFYDQLVDIRDRYGPVPVYVTENGAGYEESLDSDGRIRDDYRVAFLEQYLSAMHDAIAAGVDVKGYFIWSLLDNFEWAYGYAKRFGIIYVDYRTLERIPKTSFEYYREVLMTNGVPSAD